MEAKVIQVIKTDICRVGNGVTTPIRGLIQYWSLDGKLLAQVDSWRDQVLDNISEEEFLDIRKNLLIREKV